MKTFFFFLFYVFFVTEGNAYIPSNVRHSSNSFDYALGVFLGSLALAALSFGISYLITKSVDTTKKLANAEKWKKSEEVVEQREHKEAKQINKAVQKKVNVSRAKPVQFSVRPLITILVIYETIITCILADSNGTCMGFFSYSFCNYDGFQYLVMCLFVPAIISVIYSWKSEIARFFKKLSYVLSVDEPKNSKKRTEQIQRKNTKKKETSFGWEDWE